MTHIYLIPNLPILAFLIFHEIRVQSFEILFSLLFPVFQSNESLCPSSYLLYITACVHLLMPYILFDSPPLSYKV